VGVNVPEQKPSDEGWNKHFLNLIRDKLTPTEVLFEFTEKWVKEDDNGNLFVAMCKKCNRIFRW
jgi:hypothetical protein